ncbi:MAG: hypothetical protein RL885_32170 [Planctomycetota bacterium]
MSPDRLREPSRSSTEPGPSPDEASAAGRIFRELFPDTTPAALRVYYQALRQMTPAERGRRVIELTEAARDLARSGIRSRHPDYDAAQVEHALVRLTLGPELFARVHPGVEIEP